MASHAEALPRAAGTTKIAERDEIAELIGGYAAKVTDRIDDATLHAAKRALIDSLAVSLGALRHPAAQAARRHAYRFAAPAASEASARRQDSMTNEGCAIWGSGKRTHPELAALTNGVLLRCYDYNDFFVGQRNSGHPSDMMAGVMAVAEWAGVSGKEMLAAIAIGYDVTAACFDAFTTAPGGWDYTNLTSIGAACAMARLLKLDADQAREALAMTVIPHLASDEIESGDLNRRGDLTMWKRFNGSDAVRNALQACLLAQVGVEGAVRPFTGKLGFVAKLAGKDDPLPTLRERLCSDRAPTRVAETFMKRWPVGSQGQSAIRAALEARDKLGGDTSRIKQVRVFSEEGSYDHLVKIRQAPYAPISRETADHSLPYIVATALLDGTIRTDSFAPSRVRDPERQRFLREKVIAAPDPALGRLADGKHKRAADGYLSRVEIETLDGKILTGEAKPFPGHPRAPFSDADLEAKLRENAEPATGAQHAGRLVEALLSVERLDTVRTLAALLGEKTPIEIDGAPEE